MRHIRAVWTVLLMWFTLYPLPELYAQSAGAGADSNRADRQAVIREAEKQRIHQADKPVRPDPVGNALIGGGVTGAMKGAAAGASSAARGAIIGGTVDTYKEKNR